MGHQLVNIFADKTQAGSLVLLDMMMKVYNANVGSY